MGFEIIFHYHERKEDGKYNTEEKKSFTKNVGKKGDDSPLDKAANIILSQLARRDIWVIDVEAFEIVRKSVSFRETKGGIVLKNRKYSLDHGHLEGEDLPETPVVPIRTTASPAPTPLPQRQPKTTPSGLVMAPTPPQIFRPSRETKPEDIKQYKLSVGKKYNVLDEKLQNTSEGPTYVYVVINDEGKGVAVPCAHFDTEPVGLNQANSIGADPRLSFSNESMSNIPTLRR